jgi:hypothetical protein
MPQPTHNQVHVNRPLTNISIAYVQDADMFAYLRMFPAVPVESKSDTYFIFRKGDAKRDELQPRAPGTESAGSGFNVDQGTYNCVRWDNHIDVADEIRANADDPLDMDMASTTTLTERGMIRQERIFATNYLTTGKWGTDYTGVASSPTGLQFIKWSDYTNSDPVNDVMKARTAIHKATGMRPNKLCLAQDVADILVEHPDIIARVNNGQTTGVAQVAEYADLAKVFRVKEVVVSGAVYNKANEGATPNMDFCAAGVALLAYVADTPALMTPSAGYRFNWRHLAGNTEGLRIKKFRMENLESDRIEIGLATDMKLVGADLGALFSAAID